MKKSPLYSACALVVIVWSGGIQAQVSEDEELALVYGDKSFVTIATGTQVATARAPAVATVITAEDIKALGATDLDEVLETVPGLHVARSTQAYAPVYTIRGLHRDSNPQVLVLINGIPVTMSFKGNRGDGWGGVQLENVTRIEVIRGTGSAVYGADAFSGVINIITKTAAEIDGTRFGLRVGSFDSKDAWLLHGGKLGAIEVAAYLRAGTTDGAKSLIAADAATAFGFPSHAPGPLNTARDAIDGSLDLAYDKWRLRFGYKERDRAGSGTGIANALDPTGRSYSERVTADLTYRDRNFARDWDVSLQASTMRYKEFSDLVLFPAGTNFGGGVFTDGMIGNPYKWERHGRFDFSALYGGFERHRVRLGVGMARDEIYKTAESKNFLPGVFPFTPIGTGSFADVTDVSSTAPFLWPHNRTVRYGFVQDEWNFTKDWTLTAGLRHDAYSDFGGTTNPRLALSWDVAYNLTARLLYGTAFRAPSFVEMYAANNPVQIGNPALAPEKMQTTEAALSWQPTSKLQLGLNVFHYRMRDIIQVVGVVNQNTGRQTGSGYELEASWDAARNLRLSGHFSHQKSIDDASGQDAGNAPHDRLYLRADWRFAAGWAANAQVNAVGKRARTPGDTRSALAGYTTLDLTLHTENRGGWNFAVSARNLFDEDAREPAPATIPNDFPLPGRAVWVQAEYNL